MNTAVLAKRSRKRLSYSPETDEELFLRYCKSGNRNDFAILVKRYERELFAYLRRFLGDAELAEDAFQASFLQVHLKAESFEQGRRFRPWLYAIATNQAIDAQRRNRRHKVASIDRSGNSPDDETGKLADLLVSSAPGPAALATASELNQWLGTALAKLPESMRQVIQLVYYQGLKYRDAAEVLDVPVGTVKSRLHSAVLKLNELWNEQHPDGT